LVFLVYANFLVLQRSKYFFGTQKFMTYSKF